MAKKKKTASKKAKHVVNKPYTHHMHHINWPFVAVVAMVVATLLFIILLSYMGTIREAVMTGNL